MSKLIVSLTTIPSRVPNLHHTLNSIRCQSVSPDSIELNVPKYYSDRNLGTIDFDAIPADFNVYICDDIGPATKLFPTIKRYIGEDVIIVYCDDDRIYDKNWLKRLLEKSKAHPGCAICEESFSISNFSRKWRKRKYLIDYYFIFIQIITLGLYKKFYDKYGPHICEGFGGVLIKPEFFDIDDLIVPHELYFVDDILISGLLCKNGIKNIRTNRYNHEKSAGIKVENIDVGEGDDALKNYVHDGCDRLELNFKAINYMQIKYGIWCEGVW